MRTIIRYLKRAAEFEALATASPDHDHRKRLEDGRIELDTNTVERAIRPIALGSKNYLFAGSDGRANRWATVCSLITTGKLNDVEPLAYLEDVLQRMSNGYPVNRLGRASALEPAPRNRPH